jgi:hypothetical protein
VRISKTIGLLLLCLSLWNIVLGATGGLSMCLHAAGELHLIGTESDEDECCHPSGEPSLEESDCLECEDIKLEGVDILALRDSPFSLSAPDIAAAFANLLPEPVVCSNQELVLHSPRVPPDTIDTCLLVAEVVVLRL